MSKHTIIINNDPGDEHEHVDFSPGIKIESGVVVITGNDEQKTFDADVISLVDGEEIYSNLPVVKVSYYDYTHGLIKCPITGSENIYRVGEGVFASFETDQPFMVEITDQ